jgi:uncharacterized protein YjiS (DUF1127 family)
VRDQLRTWAAWSPKRFFLASLDDFELSKLGLTPERRDAEIRKVFCKR